MSPPAVALALMSGSGGLGKTVTALAIAGAWAERGPCWLVDTDDTKRAGTATDWLDRATPAPPPGLTWATSDRSELVDVLDRLPRPVVIDTPPGLRQGEGQAVAASVDAVLVVGSVLEVREVVAAARTVEGASSTPVAAVLTRTHPATDRSALGTAARQALDGAGVEVVGSLRRYASLEAAKLQRGLPHLVPDPRVGADVEALTSGVERWLAQTVGERAGHGQG